MKVRLISAALVTMVILGSTSAPSGASITPYAQMTKVITDANFESSAYIVTSLTANGELLVTRTNATQNAGIQTVTLTKSRKSNSVVIELLGGVLYVKGDYKILTSYLDLSKAAANKLADRWFTIPTGSSEYDEVGQGLTISSVMDQVTMTTSVKARPPAKLSGKRVDVLQGQTVKTALDPSISATLYFTTSVVPLPIEVTGTLKGSKATILFSRWGERVDLTAPKSTLQLG